MKSTKSVNKVAYIVLALFLGGIGINDFYAGKAKLGIVKIVFCWTFVPAFVALGQAIKAAATKADSNGNIEV